MKKLLGIAICLISLCSFQNEKVSAQSVTKPVEITLKQSDGERITELIYRSRAQWTAAGYMIMDYPTFKSQRPLPENIMARFQQNLELRINKEYGTESNSFVIYKWTEYGYYYELQVIEDTAGQIFPNWYRIADSYRK